MRCGLVFLGLFLFLGCGEASVNWEASDKSVAPPAILRDSTFHDANKRMPGAIGGVYVETPKLFTKQIEPTQETEESSDQKDTKRKIIYTANVELVVDNFDGIDGKVADVVQLHGGYLASTNLDRMQGERRSGRWTARVPVDKYTEFLKAIRQLGVPTSQNQDAQDVTEEFVDLDARLANKRKLEARVLELLDRTEDKIQHIIEVERELARIREEIERMEGRLRFLTDQTAMTTVQIAAREERDYVPPEAPSLGNRVSTAWSLSLDRTTNFIQNTIVFLVGNFIGIVIWIVILVIAVIVVRKLWKRVRLTPQRGEAN